MRILLVYQDESVPSSRIRVLQMAPYLESLGAACTLEAYPRTLSRLLKLAGRWREFDAVLLQKKLPSLRDTLVWNRVPCPLIFDFDDMIVLRDRPVRGSFRSLTRQVRFRRIIRRADAVIAGNADLAALCRRDQPVLICPSAVRSDVPRRSCPAGRRPPGPSGSPFRIGWIGGGGNLVDLERLAPVLQRLAARHDCVVTVVSSRVPDIPGVAVELVPWSLETQDAAVATFDAGVMPLDVDSPWSRGKCSYKLLQYMAAEVPAVGSDVGMNRTLIEHGRNGLLARSAEDWFVCLESLLADAGLRQRLGQAGRRTVEAEFTYEVQARRLFGFLAERIAARRRCAA